MFADEFVIGSWDGDLGASSYSCGVQQCAKAPPPKPPAPAAPPAPATCPPSGLTYVFDPNYDSVISSGDAGSGYCRDTTGWIQDAVASETVSLSMNPL
jgi:hypothetical protein